MLADYEKDYSTGMDIGMISGLIYDYTSGYPYLVSRICKLIDERLAGGEGYSDKASAWSETGVTETVKILLGEGMRTTREGKSSCGIIWIIII